MKSKKTFLFLLISQILFVLGSVAWFFFAVMSVMMFDTPGSENIVWAQLLFLAIWVYPLALLGSAIISWILYHYQKMKTAVAVGLIPALWLLPIIGFLLYANLS
ncbi:hypothetical protein KP806_18965 [Paenibacillus sp. N4]|uniref:hypothetical protein n=1 Tax=Paenibacillus vietnamensis TaxID=2590547 RepID=UPI001CD129B8|nr:hypothetical protein [Paenibacillus vietnamensis]MCA0757148.1 hypothetical protein [Paenibacillus vietnamensis]